MDHHITSGGRGLPALHAPYLSIALAQHLARAGVPGIVVMRHVCSSFRACSSHLSLLSHWLEPLWLPADADDEELLMAELI